MDWRNFMTYAEARGLGLCVNCRCKPKRKGGAMCAPCALKHATRSRKWARAHPHISDTQIGLDVARAILVAQGGRCALCTAEFSRTARRRYDIPRAGRGPSFVCMRCAAGIAWYAKVGPRVAAYLGK